MEELDHLAKEVHDKFLDPVYRDEYANHLRETNTALLLYMSLKHNNFVQRITSSLYICDYFEQKGILTQPPITEDAIDMHNIMNDTPKFDGYLRLMN